MIWPVRGIVTSEFGSRWGSFHPGIDIAAPEGTPIAAAKSGVVVFAGWNDGGYGNFVVLDNGGGVGTAYAHQSRIAVSEGQHVSQGQTLGYVGTTGNSTGDHLHFEVRINGQVQNPRSYLP
jgi:murein DD-endopeptidase MepM/ murein hydrolase activator NlpD